jgi:DNA helicase HerA-like ATPase
LIVSSGISAVLDMGAMHKAERARLVADLLDYLFTHNREPLWLVLEEADAFAPQQPMGDHARVLGEVDRIARRGRNFGFRLISITQRPASQRCADTAFDADRPWGYLAARPRCYQGMG